jgi:UDP-N-acetylmuramate dehydrogenase
MALKINHHFSLKSYNTFGLDHSAKGFIRISNENDLYEVLVAELSPLKIIGGGSNILLTTDQESYILHNEIKGIEIIDEDDENVLVQVGAGEQWHTFVLWTLSHHLSGLENLSLIPGSVGAAPMQNIGAYGVEQESCFHSLSAIHLVDGVKQTFFKHQCKFGYRESIFKAELKDQYFITHVRYILQKSSHNLHLEYGAIKDQLEAHQVTDPTINDVSEAVIAIRRSKLPDPKVIGNAGSFFKNPSISVKQYQSLKESYPTMPHYPIDVATVKVPAGWLIEQAGYKGLRRNNIGVHALQALVLVNYGEGDGKEIYELALEIKTKVKEQFNIDIHPEVNIW